ncbi:MAG: DUF3553 domain-containing protein [Geminicoccaceae bacterium]|nr:MAG: DUF3553 domain-containing protein [Geminicoccaceae bacterium]
MIEAVYVPGTLVQHPAHPEWGTGQVQTAINGRITVNFEHEGKVVVDARHVSLVVLRPG